jgi:rhamnogalacturonan endolyase
VTLDDELRETSTLAILEEDRAMTYRWLRQALILSVPIILSACQADPPLAPQRMSASDLSGSPEDTSPVPVGLTVDGGRVTVDTRAGLVFQVNQANCDIVSLRYRDVELQDQSKFSHIASGLGTAQVTATTSADGTIATVACETPTLTHYLVARGNTSAIFMATYITAEPAVGELRYIARLDRSRVPDGNPYADITSQIGAVEGSDVFLLANGQTRSKFYNNPPAIDNLVHGVTGPNVGVYMIMGNRESSSGGPFFRDINNQGSSQQELYNYMNSGHTQTEAYRMGLHGPYALVVTPGEAPSPDLDMSWMSGLGIKGWISERGVVTGRVSGMRGAGPTTPGGVPFVVAWANERAQYWAKVDASGGSFTSPPMIPGTYTQYLYKKELAVDTSTVIVGTGTVTEHLTYVDPPTPYIFKIGEHDGTPDGFRNADLIAFMHPSDVRMQPWGPLTYTVGQSPLSDFPMAQFQRNENTPTTIVFTLDEDEVAAHTLRIDITLAFAGARPVVTVNPGTPEAWTGPIPPATNRQQPNSRGVTRGTYRGNNMEFTVDIPASAFVAGTNTIAISSASGSAGTGFLSPSFVYDAVRLDR